MSLTSTVIRGNVVTPNGVLYGGFVEIVDDTIIRVENSSASVPKVSDSSDGTNHMHNGIPITKINLVESPWIIPGFVDIHNHGVGGCDEICDQWAYPEFSQRYLAKCGTLSTLASVIFSKTRPDATKAVIDSIESRACKVFDNCAVIEGVHAEGPVIRDQGGLPAPDNDISLEDFKKLCQTMPHMKIMTISPSKDAPKNYGRIRHLLNLGVRVSLGHDKHATASDIIGAMEIAKEMRFDPSTSHLDSRLHCTHMYNVMAFHHREPSLVNILLCRHLPLTNINYKDCQVPTVEIICDLIHSHPITVQALLSARPVEDIAIITDCISSYEPGKRSNYNGRKIIVRAEGACYLCDNKNRPTKTIAGSTVTMADQFLNLITYFQLDITTACLMLATNPARFAKIDHVGSIEVGKKANILLINGELNVITRRMIYGRWFKGEPHKMLKCSLARL